MEGEHEIGDYWYGLANWKWTWLIKTRTGTFTAHCKEDAMQAAENAKQELRKYNRKQKLTFQQKVEYIMEDMLAYYEDMHDISKEIAMWADDYVSMTEQLVKP